MDLATEKHVSEAKILESETNDGKKKAGSKSSKKGKLKKAGSTELLDETSQSDSASSEFSPQQEALKEKQAATLEDVKTLTNQLNLEAMNEHAHKLRSLPKEVRDAVNVCVSAHFPDLVDQAGDTKVDGDSCYGDVFLG